jgi:hypothetical protein
MPALQRDGNFRLVPHRPRRRLAMLALLLAAVFGVGALGYWYGVSRARLDAEYLQALIRRDRAAEERIAELRRQVVDAELARAVDQQATQSLRETITTLRDEIAELRDEAALYRNMLDPQGVGASLRVADLELTPGELAGEFRYYVLVTRSDVDGDTVRGTLDLQLRGVETSDTGRRERILSLRDLAELDPYPIPFRFRYFQAVSGTLTLPPGYEPSKVVIRLAQPGRRETLRKEFDWQPGPG